MVVSNSSEDKTVPMRYVARANVLPEYVRAYIDDGWTLATMVTTTTPCKHSCFACRALGIQKK